ncbi:MAG TPA: ATP synthase F1 subunit delta [bacterium]|nr:ATP synthase F1 subunit delta [bacterium]
MADTVLPGKYAEALFILARKEGAVERVKNDLGFIRNTIHKNPSFAAVINHPGVAREEKKKIAAAVFEASVARISLNFLMLLIDKKREKIIESVAFLFAEKADESMGIKKLTITTARKLEEEEKNKLIKKLESAVKKKLVVNAEVNPEILGGIIIRDRLKLIDASVVQFLNGLKADLKAAKAEGAGKIKKAPPKKAKKRAKTGKKSTAVKPAPKAVKKPKKKKK